MLSHVCAYRASGDLFPQVCSKPRVAGREAPPGGLSFETVASEPAEKTQATPKKKTQVTPKKKTQVTPPSDFDGDDDDDDHDGPDGHDDGDGDDDNNGACAATISHDDGLCDDDVATMIRKTTQWMRLGTRMMVVTIEFEINGASHKIQRLH